MTVVLVGCGGGQGSAEPARLTLSASLGDRGTTVVCDATQATAVVLERDNRVEGTWTCPFRRVLDGDRGLSDWLVRPASTAVGAASAAGAAVAAVRTRTRLPLPKLVALPEALYLFRPEVLGGLAGGVLRVQVEMGAGEMRELAVEEPVLRIATAPGAAPVRLTWLWDVDGQRFVSDPRAVATMRPQAIGPLVGMAAFRSTDDNRDRFFGALEGSINVSDYERYVELGLERLVAGDRKFRDLRLVDLDGDGRDDIVSNVYADDGLNPLDCTVIAFNEGEGRYSFVTPRRADGSCVGGHGETILVADFDGDGRTDVFLPSYERFDLLMNRGGRRFVEDAEARGVHFPAYLPAVEGAAAVDIDMDGHIDIVAASEVLINDGTGHFNALPQPFGPERLFDEGLAVADLDGDGHFDIVKHDPVDGPRVFWGLPGEHTFAASDLLLGRSGTLTDAYGLTVADLKGNGLLDVVLSGGTTTNGSPLFCLHGSARAFTCAAETLDSVSARQDLLMALADPETGVHDLYFRTGEPQVFRVRSGAPPPAHRFALDLVDAAGLRNQHGRAMQVTCADGGPWMALRAVDGGNGYMSQGGYRIELRNDECERILVDVFTRQGKLRFGPLAEGLHSLQLR